jgi:hypothetical protein
MFQTSFLTPTKARRLVERRWGLSKPPLWPRMRSLWRDTWTIALLHQ